MNKIIHTFHGLSTIRRTKMKEMMKQRRKMPNENPKGERDKTERHTEKTKGNKINQPKEIYTIQSETFSNILYKG